MYGCLDGYTGSRCDQAFDPSEQRENDGSFVQGLAAGLGLALVAVAGIVATLILRQRWTTANAECKIPSNPDVTGYEVPDEAHLEAAPDYQNIAMTNVSSSPSTYQDLNQDRRDGPEYSTIDENTATYCN